MAMLVLFEVDDLGKVGPGAAAADGTIADRLEGLHRPQWIIRRETEHGKANVTIGGPGTSIT